MCCKNICIKFPKSLEVADSLSVGIGAVCLDPWWSVSAFFGASDGFPSLKQRIFNSNEFYLNWVLLVVLGRSGESDFAGLDSACSSITDLSRPMSTESTLSESECQHNNVRFHYGYIDLMNNHTFDLRIFGGGFLTLGISWSLVCGRIERSNLASFNLTCLSSNRE